MKQLFVKVIIKRKTILFFVILLVIHVVFLFFYRPFAYNQYAVLSRFSMANIYPSISCIPIGYLFIKLIPQKTKFKSVKNKSFLLLCVMLGNYLYEGLDIYLGAGAWYDMIGITIGGVIVLLFIFINLKMNNINNC